MNYDPWGKGNLLYTAHTDPEYAVSGILRKMQGMADRIKSNEEVTVSYMKRWEWEQKWFYDGKKRRASSNWKPHSLKWVGMHNHFVNSIKKTEPKLRSFDNQGKE